MNLKEICHIMS